MKSDTDLGHRSAFRYCVLRLTQKYHLQISVCQRRDCVKCNLYHPVKPKPRERMNSSDPPEDLTEINPPAKSEDCHEIHGLHSRNPH